MSDEVYLSSPATRMKIYHTDRNCQNLPNEHRKMDLDEAKKMEYEECSFCAGEVDYRIDSRRKSLRQLVKEDES